MVPRYPYRSESGQLAFWDSSKHISWLKSKRVAQRIANQSSLLDDLRTRLDEWRQHPHNDLTVRVWDDLLMQGPEAVSARITAVDEAGELARDTMPTGIALSDTEIMGCIAERHRQKAEGLVVYGCEA